MSRMMSLPVSWLPVLLLVIGNAGPLAAQLERPPTTRLPLERPPTTRPTIVPAGPSYLSATGYMPTRIMLRWRAVPNAQFYRVNRANPVEPRHKAYDLSLAQLAASQEMETGDYWNVNWPVDETSTYTYDIQAGFVDAVGIQTLSTPSPAASVKSPPYVAPANVRHTTALYNVPGKLYVTITWDPVPNASGYFVAWESLGNSPFVPSLSVYQKTSRPFDNVSPKSRYNVCVSTIYLATIRNDQVRNCITVKT